MVDVAEMDTAGTVPCWVSDMYFMMGVASVLSADIFLSTVEQKC
jgi:hypothetical protein